jgi:hypothetical protein
MNEDRSLQQSASELGMVPPIDPTNFERLLAVASNHLQGLRIVDVD